MYPDRFPEKNRTLHPPKDMDNCEPLDVWTDGRYCASRWKMSWRERFSALFFGRVWVRVWFGQTQPPISVEATRTIFITPTWRERIAGLYQVGKRSDDSRAR